MRFLSEYTGKDIACSCGRRHSVRTRDVRVGSGAVRELPELLENCGISGKGLLVCDSNTRRAAGEKISAVLNSAGFVFQELLLPGEHVHAEAEHLPLIRSALHQHSCGWLLAAGSGSINDMVKLAASGERVPYVIIGTAASMDGFLSANAAILEDGVKKQYLNLVPPAGAVMDADFLKTAPFEMTLSGLGDALGKFTSLAEWRLNRLCADEFFCPETAALVRREVMDLLLAAESDSPDSEPFFNALVRTLLITGIAMQMLGNSTPASGGEHYISHALDMYGFAVSGDAPSAHGLQVALGTRFLLREYRRFFHAENRRPFRLRRTFYETHIADWRKIGVDLSEMIHAKADFLARLQGAPANVDSAEMRAEADFLLSLAPRIESVYRKAGLPEEPEQLGISAGLFEFARIHAVDMRKRLTLLDFTAAGTDRDREISS